MYNTLKAYLFYGLDIKFLSYIKGGKLVLRITGKR
ncbi:hypothetical protein Stok01_01970 [Sulfurisphaera tokodaii]